MSKLDSKCVVKYYNSWKESIHLYIHMECCEQNLRTVFTDKRLVFGRQSPAEPMSSHEYYISCEIFRELLKSLQYLHGLKHPIIHRDLKPENILILCTDNKGVFLKLGDFGLATNQDRTALTQGAGTRKYMATEVGFSQSYDCKADIYSLGLIGYELFEIYSFGNNCSGCLGLRHIRPVKSPQIIQQLCHQNIQYFVNGYIYCSYGSSFAITTDGHVFSWGDNRAHHASLHKDSDRRLRELYLRSKVLSTRDIPFIPLHDIILVGHLVSQDRDLRALAQWIGSLALMPKVAGSSPGGRTALLSSFGDQL
ncbi:unnamed protein product [Medioppia subpectinata]|uniref:Protein kinase domain-containing protein n=1 Tax=Medioppia subpectinata TaxID=1979941 RepID=A0A7R9PTT7_9ACAR|nr:unnamed protein product [Medioppia subpectinata]CAG2100072.1 unnamed protein product [Medioppia subpectinata]